MTPAALKILFLDGIGTPIYILQHIYEEFCIFTTKSRLVLKIEEIGVKYIKTMHELRVIL